MKGFMSAVALIISITMLPDLLGLRASESDYPIGTLINILQNLSHTRGYSVLLGSLLMLLIICLKTAKKHCCAPNQTLDLKRVVLKWTADLSALLALVLGILCSYMMELNGVDVVQKQFGQPQPGA